MKKRNLKDMFLGLFAGARRRAGDKPPGDSFEAPSARAETESETGGRLSQKPPGPPADWIAKRSGGPPAHWVERAPQVTPETLRNGKRDEADATSQLQDPRQIQRKSAAPAPLRLERPAPASRSSLDSPQKPIMRTESRPDDHRRPGRRKQEPSLPFIPVNTQKRDADDLEKNSKESPEMRVTESTVRSGDEDTAYAPGNDPSLKDDGAETVSCRQYTEQEDVGQKNVNRRAEQLRAFPTGAEHQEFPTPPAIGTVKVTRRQVVRYSDISRAEAQRAPVRYDRVTLDSSDGNGDGIEEVVPKPVEPAPAQDRTN